MLKLIGEGSVLFTEVEAKLFVMGELGCWGLWEMVGMMGGFGGCAFVGTFFVGVLLFRLYC